MRVKAARIRADAEAAGAGTTEDVLAAALKRAELVVETFEPGSAGFAPNLRGRLDRTCSMVFVSVDLPPPQALFVKAHELGHFHLHDDPILDDHSEETETDAVIRSDGYSNREVKELQADVFAAEFLCPSAELRETLATGVPARMVAARLGVDPTLVLQQAAQALLQSPGETARWTPPEPDEAQLACATAPSPILVFGGPGSARRRPY